MFYLTLSFFAALGHTASKPVNINKYALKWITKTYQQIYQKNFGFRGIFHDTGGQARYALRGQAVTVVEYPGEGIELLHGDEVLAFKVFDEPRRAIPPADDKTLNKRVDELLRHRRWSEKSRPAPNHPWHEPFEPTLSANAQLAVR